MLHARGLQPFFGEWYCALLSVSIDCSRLGAGSIETAGKARGDWLAGPIDQAYGPSRAGLLASRARWLCRAGELCGAYALDAAAALLHNATGAHGDLRIGR